MCKLAATEECVFHKIIFRGCPIIHISFLNGVVGKTVNLKLIKLR